MLMTKDCRRHFRPDQLRKNGDQKFDWTQKIGGLA